MSTKDRLKYLVKSLFKQYPKKFDISSEDGKVEIELEYYTREKFGEYIGNPFYFSTEFSLDDEKECMQAIKELLRIKKFLKLESK